MKHKIDFFDQTEDSPSIGLDPNGKLKIMFAHDMPHVVFKSAVGEVVFGQKSKNYHVGCEVIATCGNFEAAVEFIKKYEAENGTPIK